MPPTSAPPLLSTWQDVASLAALLLLSAGLVVVCIVQARRDKARDRRIGLTGKR